MTIVIFASKLASVINRNPYCKPEETALEMFSRDFYPQYIKTLERLNMIERVDFIVEPNAKLVEISPKLVELISSDQPDLPEIDAFARNEGLGDSNLENDIKKYIQTERGIWHETANMQQLGIEYTQPVVPYKMTLTLSNGDDILLYGRIDGLAIDSEGKEYVIESKNRQYKLFNEVRDYERIQCVAYIKLTNSTKCLLAEHFNGSHINHWIHTSDDEWRDIVIQLETFCVYFKSMLMDESMQNDLVSGTAKIFQRQRLLKRTRRDI
jgi:hypothetical protein